MASRGNPVLDVINSMSAPVQSMGVAARTGSMAGQSFEKGASLALKLDTLLSEEEARLQNNVFKAQDMMRKTVAMQIDANYKDASLDMQAQQFNALQKQRQFTNDLNLANAKDSNYWKGIQHADKVKSLDYKQFEREYKSLGLLKNKIRVRDAATGLYKEEYTPEYKKALAVFQSRWGVGSGGAATGIAPTTNTPTTPLGPVADQQQPTIPVIQPPEQPVIGNDVAPQDDYTYDPKDYQLDNRPAPATVEVPKPPAYTGNLPGSFQEANTLLGEAQLGKVSLNNEQRMAIRERFTEAGKGKAANDILREMSNVQKEVVKPTTAKVEPTSLAKLGIPTVQNKNGSLKIMNPEEALNGNVIKIVANGKEETIYKTMALDAKGNVATEVKNALYTAINPEAIVVAAPTGQLFDSLKEQFMQVEPIAQKTFAKKAFESIVKYRPDVLMDNNIANDISIMFGDALDKKAINMVRTSIASAKNPELRKVADKTATLLTKMVEYRGFNKQLPEYETKNIDDFIHTAKLYSFNPTILGNVLNFTWNANNRDIDPDKVEFDPDKLKQHAMRTITEEYKTQGYSPTMSKIKAFTKTVQSDDGYDIALYGNGRLAYNPHSIVEKDLSKQGLNGKEINKVMLKLFGTKQDRYYSPDSLAAIQKGKAKRIAAHSKVYQQFIDSIAEQDAVNDTLGFNGRKMTVSIDDNTTIKLDMNTVRKLMAWQYASSIERNEDGLFD